MSQLTQPLCLFLPTSSNWLLGWGHDTWSSIQGEENPHPIDDRVGRWKEPTSPKTSWCPGAVLAARRLSLNFYMVEK